MGEGADVLIVTFFYKELAGRAVFQKRDVQAAAGGEGKLHASPTLFVPSETIAFQIVHFTRNKCAIL